MGGYIVVPPEVRETWSRAATCGEAYDIFEIEAIGPALILYNFEKYMAPNALWVHYIDNDAALATLVKGSSSVLSGEVITAYTHSRVAAIGLWPWFDRVASPDNPVDKLFEAKWRARGRLWISPSRRSCSMTSVNSSVHNSVSSSSYC